MSEKIENSKARQRMVRAQRALRCARQYLIDCSPLLDGEGEWNNPQSGVGAVVASIDEALRYNDQAEPPRAKEPKE